MDPASEERIEVHWDLPEVPSTVNRERPVQDHVLQKAVAAALVYGNRGGAALELVLVTDATLTDMHARFLGDPTPTDVISFDLGEEGYGPVGELYVSVDCAHRLAEQRGVSVERELVLYAVHGALHLCGYDDIDPQDRMNMRAAEQAVMRSLGYDDDLSEHDIESHEA